jgi:hypothetical protein
VFEKDILLAGNTPRPGLGSPLPLTSRQLRYPVGTHDGDSVMPFKNTWHILCQFKPLAYDGCFRGCQESGGRGSHRYEVSISGTS